jgi:hypothetical protein
MRYPLRNIAGLLIVACSIGIIFTSEGWASDVQSARAFLEQVYAKYAGAGKGPDTLGKDAPDLFAPELLALIREDQRISRGEVGLLDHDPICSCQDTAAFQITAVQVTPMAQSRAKAKVSFVNGGHPVRVGFSLIKDSGHWRILDIAEPTVPSLKRYLRDGLAKSRSSTKP